MESSSSSRPKHVSREVREKSESMKQFKNIFSTVEIKVYEIAGGTSMEEIQDLQKKIKKERGIRTARADWRTKTGIILWFCKNWDIISKFIEKYRSSVVAVLDEEEKEEKQVEIMDNTSDEIFDDGILYFNNDQEYIDISCCWNEVVF